MDAPVASNGPNMTDTSSIPGAWPAHGQTQVQQQQQLGQDQHQTQHDDEQSEPLILDEALGYISNVKAQLADCPDVYESFLDTTRDFKNGAVDIHAVIARITQLFPGNPKLIQGFNTFLPTGYLIECEARGDDLYTVRVSTPMGETVQWVRQSRPALGSVVSQRADGASTQQPEEDLDTDLRTEDESEQESEEGSEDKSEDESDDDSGDCPECQPQWNKLNKICIDLEQKLQNLDGELDEKDNEILELKTKLADCRQSNQQYAKAQARFSSLQYQLNVATRKKEQHLGDIKTKDEKLKAQESALAALEAKNKELETSVHSQARGMQQLREREKMLGFQLRQEADVRVAFFEDCKSLQMRNQEMEMKLKTQTEDHERRVERLKTVLAQLGLERVCELVPLFKEQKSTIDRLEAQLDKAKQLKKDDGEQDHLIELLLEQEKWSAIYCEVALELESWKEGYANGTIDTEGSKLCASITAAKDTEIAKLKQVQILLEGLKSKAEEDQAVALKWFDAESLKVLEQTKIINEQQEELETARSTITDLAAEQAYKQEIIGDLKREIEDKYSACAYVSILDQSDELIEESKTHKCTISSLVEELADKDEWMRDLERKRDEYEPIADSQLATDSSDAAYPVMKTEIVDRLNNALDLYEELAEEYEAQKATISGKDKMIDELHIKYKQDASQAVARTAEKFSVEICELKEENEAHKSTISSLVEEQAYKEEIIADLQRELAGEASGPASNKFAYEWHVLRRDRDCKTAAVAYLQNEVQGLTHASTASQDQIRRLLDQLNAASTGSQLTERENSKLREGCRSYARTVMVHVRENEELRSQLESEHSMRVDADMEAVDKKDFIKELEADINIYLRQIEEQEAEIAGLQARVAYHVDLAQQVHTRTRQSQVEFSMCRDREQQYRCQLLDKSNELDECKYEMALKDEQLRQIKSELAEMTQKHATDPYPAPVEGCDGSDSGYTASDELDESDAERDDLNKHYAQCNDRDCERCYRESYSGTHVPPPADAEGFVNVPRMEDEDIPPYFEEEVHGVSEDDMSIIGSEEGLEADAIVVETGVAETDEDEDEDLYD